MRARTKTISPIDRAIEAASGREGMNICVPTRGAPTKTNTKTRRIEEKVEEGEEQSAAAAIKRGKGRSRRRRRREVHKSADLGRTAVSGNGQMQSAALANDGQ